METLIFYSYKGGQGRTTALANLAACLYRLGKHVVLLDLDVECPGLPAKFGIPTTAEFSTLLRDAGGIVDYLTEAVRAVGGPPPALGSRVISLPVTEEDPLLTRPPDAGSLSLIATGAVSARYVEKLQMRSWHTLEGRSRLTPKTLAFWDQLRQTIQNLTPQPDYLLVDLSSGITPLGRAVLTAWTPAVLVFFGLDEENLSGTRFAMDWIEAVPGLVDEIPGRNSVPRLSVYPVLSRIAPFVTDSGAQGLRTKAAVGLFDDASRADEIYLARTDLELEEHWYLHFPLLGPISHYPLTSDYLSLVSSLLRIEGGEASSPGSLRAQLNIPERIMERHKIFGLAGSQGVMINLADQQRNVSFKVKTFLSMIDDIHSGIVNDLMSEKEVEAAPKGNRPLYHAGRLCGLGFGASLMTEIWDDAARRRRLADRIAEWCAFDSDVGFGMLTCHELDETPLRVVGVLQVSSNFLISGRGTADRHLCELLAGYISGVLQRIIEVAEVSVSHSEQDCPQMNPGLGASLFRFSAARRARAS